jgi:hypothetical protein
VHAGSIPAVASTRRNGGRPVTSSRFAKRGWLCYRPGCRGNGPFPGSSVVEQPAVNRLVAGSNPARGATKIKHFSHHLKISVRQRYTIGTDRT